jgi:hypothetical protein
MPLIFFIRMAFMLHISRLTCASWDSVTVPA